MVSLHLFAKLGEELKLEETQEFKKVIENAKTDILAQLAMKEILGGITVTEEELTAFYEMNKQEFKKGATINAKHILCLYRPCDLTNFCRKCCFFKFFYHLSFSKCA